MQPDIQVGLTRKLLYPQSKLFKTRALPDEDARQTLPAQAFLTRLRMDMDKVARIHKKALGLDRVFTKAEPKTRGWSKILQMITAHWANIVKMFHLSPVITGPLGMRMVRI